MWLWSSAVCIQVGGMPSSSASLPPPASGRSPEAAKVPGGMDIPFPMGRGLSSKMLSQQAEVSVVM